MTDVVYNSTSDPPYTLVAATSHASPPRAVTTSNGSTAMLATSPSPCVRLFASSSAGDWKRSASMPHGTARARLPTWVRVRRGHAPRMQLHAGEGQPLQHG